MMSYIEGADRCTFMHTHLQTGGIYTYIYTYVTRHKKIGLMCTKHTVSHYFTYLAFRDSNKSSVSCNE